MEAAGALGWVGSKRLFPSLGYFCHPRNKQSPGPPPGAGGSPRPGLLQKPLVISAKDIHKLHHAEMEVFLNWASSEDFFFFFLSVATWGKVLISEGRRASSSAEGALL